MPQIKLPLTAYSVREKKPNQRYGSPAYMPVRLDKSRILYRVPLDKIPLNSVITSATLRVFSHKAATGSKNLSVYPITSSWSASVKWAKQPTVGALIQTVTKSDPAKHVAWDFNVTAWADLRLKRGLELRSTSDPAHWIRGSSGANHKPILIVDYTVISDAPGDLKPDGGSVSVAAPILTFAGEPDMTSLNIEFSTDGSTVSYASAAIAATVGRYDPALDPGANPVLTNGGAGIYWRAQTTGPSSQSEPSQWAYYEYDALPAVAITSPGATTDDGTPTVTWTVGGTQAAWQAEFTSGSTLIEKTEWADEPATRDWTPDNGIAVPNGVGSITVEVVDAIAPRVAAPNAPTTAKATINFITSLSSAGTAIDTIAYTYAEPVVVISGTRAAGTPTEVALFRDGVAVPLWDPDDGTFYPDWAPGSVFFTGTAFVIPDYTVDARHEHTWQVRTRVTGTAYAGGPTVTRTPVANSVWLLDPRSGDKIEVQGYNELPVVEQITEEQSVLHVPINQGLLTEPKRRRLLRTTRSGTLAGVVLNDDETTLDEWVAGDSAEKYRLIFGKVNWSVILGDYSPTDVFYPDGCGPDRVLVSLNWWQRLGNR